MDCESDCGEVVDAKTSVSDNKHVKFSPRVKVMNAQGGGCGPFLETTLKENESGSVRSLDSSDIVSSSCSCEDISQVNPHMILESIGEDSIPQPTARSNRLEDAAKECPESTSQQADANHTCLVEHVLPTLSPSIQVMECREDLNNSVEPPKLGQSFRSGELCQSGEPPKSRGLCQSGEAYKSEEILKSRERQSTEHLMANDSNRPGRRNL